VAAQQGLHALATGHTLPDRVSNGVVQHAARKSLAQQGTLYQLEYTVALSFGWHYYDTSCVGTASRLTDNVNFSHPRTMFVCEMRGDR
jgi:hypothetical protein